VTTEKATETAAAVVVPTPTPPPTPPLPTAPLTHGLRVTVDRTALKQAILALANPNAKQDWCIACGAGASASPLDKVEALHPLAKEILGGKTLPQFIAELKDFGKQAWCVACGAGKDASPLDTIGNPADISNEVIDALAGRLLSAVRVG